MSLNNNINKFKFYIKRYGIRKTSAKVFKRIFHIKENRKSNQEQYKIWIKNHELTEDDLKLQRDRQFKITPKISIVVPMYNTSEVFFKELIESVENQTYSNWELCFADGSEKENSSLKKYYENNSKIKYRFLNANKGISENTNEAIKLTTGDYIAFLDHDDILSIDALYEVVNAINENENLEFIYSDEDKIDENYERFEPYFKPDFSPETLLSNNYITHLVVLKKTLVDKIGFLDSKYNGAQDFDYLLRASENTKNIYHISKILYHWRVHSLSSASSVDAKEYAFVNGAKVVENHLKRQGIESNVEHLGEVPGIYKINFKIENEEKINILIPNKDNVKLLKNAIDSILNLTIYKNYEIDIIENNSTLKETFDYYKEISKNNKIKILDYNKEYQDKEFNYSKLINFGVKNVDGKYILQLNNDVKVITKDWLEQFVGYLKIQGVGIVGARLYYEDKSIQHAGIILGLSGIAGNMLVNLPYGKHAYYAREAAPRNCMAVTGACLFSKRELYEELGYMDEENFKVAFNDVDFCLKAVEKGYRVVYDPYIELYHYESKSRGYELSTEKEKRFNDECQNFKNKWKKLLDNGDPYYNKNFSYDTCNYDIRED